MVEWRELNSLASFLVSLEVLTMNYFFCVLVAVVVDGDLHP